MPPNSLRRASLRSKPLSVQSPWAARHRGSASGSGALSADHLRGHRRDLHLAEPRADIGGETRIGSNRREFRGLAGADPDAGIRHQPAGGGDDVARTQRGVEREVDRSQPGGIAAVAGAVGAQRLAIGERVFAVGIAFAIAWTTRRRWCCRRRPWSRSPGRTPGTSEPARRCRASAENTCRRSCARKTPARNRLKPPARGGDAGCWLRPNGSAKKFACAGACRCCCFWSAAEQKIEQAFGRRHARRAASPNRRA